MISPKRRSTSLEGRTARMGGALVLACGLLAGEAHAQADLRDITQPIPVVNARGHSAPVRALVFASPSGSRLLSAGLDKVVNVWNLDALPTGPVQTIRPRIWRGRAGSIHALALSSRADAQGQRLLAVAGVGVESSRGEIGLFRFPGLNRVATGDVVGQFPGGAPNGHTINVTCLAFDPGGTLLASGSNDATVRLWDVATRRTSRVLRGHTGPVNALAFAADGARLVTGGADGLVNLWDVRTGALVASARPDPRLRRANDPAGDAINTLAVGPDRGGRWLVIGRENGDLIRYEAANLTAATVLPRGRAGQGAIEALAISHDGRRLVTTAIANRLERWSDRPRVECDVDLRSMPDGTLQTRLATASDLVLACAFSPDDRRLAFAGGDTQAIRVLDISAANQAPIVLEGQGSSIWDVGFAADSRAIGFARRRPDLPNPPAAYEDFDLRGQRVREFALTELSRAIPTWGGWRVRPIDPFTLDLLDGQGRGHRLKLDPGLDGRWWSYTLLPPAPAHPSGALAIGSKSGAVIVHRLSDGARTRYLAGHGGAVYAVAPSPDGLWLATGSSDQTVRLWTLAGCDRVPGLGVRFVPDGPGRLKASEVAARGFAEAMGMKPEDQVEELYVGGRRLNPTATGTLDALTPNTMIEFVVLRGGKRIPLNSTKRDSPALTLFAARDREWVVWTPRGYYDTSPIGDRRYLGWHRNRLLAGQPTDYFAFDNFEKDLRRPEALRRFLDTGDPRVFDPPQVAGQAVRTPERIVSEDLLPRVQVLAPARPAFDPLAVGGAALTLRVQASRDPEALPGQGLIRSVRILVDTGRARELAFNQPVVDQQVPVNLNPGRHTVSVIAVNDLGKERVESFEVVAPEPPRPIALEAPRLVVLAIGADDFSSHDRPVPRIPFADKDAQAVGAFLGAPGGRPRFGRVDVIPLSGPDASVARIDAALKSLDDQRGRGELGQGDAVFVMLESHYLDLEKTGVVLGTEAARGSPPSPAVRADRIVETLGALADYGCTVMVLIDALHADRPLPQQSNRGLNEWARALYRRNVITFMATIHGPSLAPLVAKGHGVFAQGVLDSLNVQGRARLSGDPKAPLSLFEFQDRVAQNVLAATNRRQHARCYIPEAVPSQLPIFDPPRRSQPKNLRAAND